MNNVNTLLNSLKDFIMNGTLTPTNKIDQGTFICAVEATPNGKIYYQNPLESWPKPWQDALRNKRKGSTIRAGNGNEVKVVAIFDMWV